MKPEYVLPGHGLDAFNCPNCHVYCRQQWYYLNAAERPNGFGLQLEDKRFTVSNCERCKFPTIWHGKKMVYPLGALAVPPNSDLPPDVRADFEEARTIAGLSPRGAAALLRLAIQKLCIHLGQRGASINDDVKTLVAAGLPPKVQQALDAVRVIGNEAVHPGTLDLRDDLDTVNSLFSLVNFIAQKMLSEPKEIESIYGALPIDKLAAIEKRDGPKGN